MGDTTNFDLPTGKEAESKQETAQASHSPSPTDLPAAASNFALSSGSNLTDPAAGFMSNSQMPKRQSIWNTPSYNSQVQVPASAGALFSPFDAQMAHSSGLPNSAPPLAQGQQSQQHSLLMDSIEEQTIGNIPFTGNAPRHPSTSHNSHSSYDTFKPFLSMNTPIDTQRHPSGPNLTNQSQVRPNSGSFSASNFNIGITTPGLSAYPQNFSSITPSLGTTSSASSNPVVGNATSAPPSGIPSQIPPGQTSTYFPGPAPGFLSQQPMQGMCTLFIHNIPSDVTVRELRLVFALIPDFAGCEFKKTSVDGSVPGESKTGVVQLHSYQSGQYCCSMLDGRGDLFDGAPLKCELFGPRQYAGSTSAGSATAPEYIPKLKTAPVSATAAPGSGKQLPLTAGAAGSTAGMSASGAHFPAASTVSPGSTRSSFSGVLSDLSSASASSNSMTNTSTSSTAPTGVTGVAARGSRFSFSHDVYPPASPPSDSTSTVVGSSIPGSGSSSGVASVVGKKNGPDGDKTVENGAEDVARSLQELSITSPPQSPMALVNGVGHGPGQIPPSAASKIVMQYSPGSSSTSLQVLQNGGRVLPPANPADQNPPCNTLYVGNLPMNASEEELKSLFSSQRGYKRLSFKNKGNGPMCFVEFEDVAYATRALTELYGRGLSNSVKGGIRLSFSKNPLGVRSQSKGNNSGGMSGSGGSSSSVGLNTGASNNGNLASGQHKYGWR